MIVSRRFALLTTSTFAALLLSACQPAAQDTQPTPIEETTPPVIEIDQIEDEHESMDHDSMDDETLTNDSVTDESQMTDVLKDYKKSMTSMHDEMMIGMGYNDPDTAFAKGMLGHHRGAIDMAKIQAKYGTNEVMRELAENIVTTQQVEVDILNKWLASHVDTANPKPETEPMQQAYAKAMANMHSDMTLGIADPMPDLAFARGMLPHHIGAVEMAKIELKYGTDEDMRQLAQNIIDNQQAEIELMQNWIVTLEVLNNTDNDNAANNDITETTTPNSQVTEDHAAASEHAKETDIAQ